MPLVAWSRRRRLLAALLIALAVFGLGANAWVAADLGGAEASRLLLGEAQRRVDKARAAVAQIPALRASAAATRSTRPAVEWTSTDDVRAVSQLAARSGMTLLTLEPGTLSGTGIDAVRPLRMTAQADFAQLVVFLRALSSLPILVVPGEVSVKRPKEDASRRQDGTLSVSATLNVFNALRPLNSVEDLLADDAAGDEEDVVFYDPFSAPSTRGARLSDAVALRLVGLLYDLARGLALVETADGETTLEAGQRIRDESVARIDERGITLATRDGDAHTLTFEEAVQ